jgi:phage baseplate assembly protein W
MTMDNGRLFGRSIGFPPRIGADGRWAWSEGSDNIRESIQIILMTEPGERVMLNTFGCGLRRYLFEPNTPATRRLIQERVQDALRLWEPRLIVESVAVEPDAHDAQKVIVTISYKLVASQTAAQLSLTMTLGA